MTQTSFVGTKFFGFDLSQLIDRFWSLRRKISKRVLLLEFSSSALTVAQACLRESEIEFTHLRRVVLPESAVERGIPTDPATMAALLKELCREHHIYAHRAAVVLPPEAVFSKLIDIPEHFSLAEARQYLRDPASGVQIPIPLHQTDFDLVPTSLPVIHAQETTFRKYLLTTVPQKIVEQLLLTLQLADLELYLIELGLISQLRLIAPEIFELAANDFLIVLELLPECTQLMIVAASGPVMFDRLAAIREFSEPSLDPSQTQAALAEALSAESMTVADERYLPISDLDLRVLVQELRQTMHRFGSDFNCCRWKSIAITGLNSAHPMLSDLLSASLGLRVDVVRPTASEGVGHVSMSELLVHQGLGRILGLGLGMMPHQALGSYPSSNPNENPNWRQSLEQQSSALPDASVLPFSENQQASPIASVIPSILNVDEPIQPGTNRLKRLGDVSALTLSTPTEHVRVLNEHLPQESCHFEGTSFHSDNLTLESLDVEPAPVAASTDDSRADEQGSVLSDTMVAQTELKAPTTESSNSMTETQPSILGELRLSDDSTDIPVSDV